MLHRLRFILLGLLCAAAGCFQQHGGTDLPPASDAGVPTADAARPTPGPVPLPIFDGGRLEETCGLREGRSRFVLVPTDPAAPFGPLCDTAPSTYLEIETRRLPESVRTIRDVEDAGVRVTLCQDGECMDAVGGAVDMLVHRGEVGTVGFDIRFPDGRITVGEAEILNFCEEFCPAPMSVEAFAEPACGPDDSPGWRLTLQADAACDAPSSDHIILLIYQDVIPPSTFFELRSDRARAQVCSDGVCHEALEGVIRVDRLEPGAFGSGEYIFFASPGTDYSGRFHIVDWCRSPVLCG